MPIVQFRVHPGIGCARMGNSDKAYHLASEFPHFLQEEFPNLRFKPKARTHPKKFFLDDIASSATGTLATYEIFDTTGPFDDKFKEVGDKIFPQAARFRVFAYVYDDITKRRPHKVFEVTPEIASITWKVNIANKKSNNTAMSPPRHPNMTGTSSDLNTTDTSLLCKRLRPVAGLPNLAYIFLERDEVDKSKLTGRLHVIGNEGEFKGSIAPTSLWSDDWYDSAGDGSVEAIVTPVGGGAPLRAEAGAASAADLQLLDYGVGAPQAGTATPITAMPGWVVVACPDYVPDMGHFVSLWDLALSRGFTNIESKSGLAAQPGKHKLITKLDHFDGYKSVDYLVHIHPLLCLFEDVRFVSGEAIGDPEDRPRPPEGRAHNLHPDPTGTPATPTEGGALDHGGAFIEARAKKADLANPAMLKESDSSKPIAMWLKRAIFGRLRKPGTLYDVRRQFAIILPGTPPSMPPKDATVREYATFPRKLGRRMDYDRPDTDSGDRDKFYKFPNYEAHGGHLLKFHGLPDAGQLCGQTSKSPPTAGPPGSSFSTAELDLLKWLDDMYWPATVADMPLLRELAFTPFQYEQFKVWKGDTTVKDVRSENIFDQIISPRLRSEFTLLFPLDADSLFSQFLAERPLYAPAMIDMAHLGTMLGGSFLPGIEVGREAGIAENWCLFHGASKHFPSIRFKPAKKDAEHTIGTLTKDLAVPWTEDFKACDEAFWPTSRPGRTTKDALTLTRHNWQIKRTDAIPHLGRTAHNAVEFVQEYWRALGFIRRTAADTFIEEEQSWH